MVLRKYFHVPLTLLTAAGVILNANTCNKNFGVEKVFFCNQETRNYRGRFLVVYWGVDGCQHLGTGSQSAVKQTN
jgi:hypothetical protein